MQITIINKQVDVAYKRFKHWFQEEDLERVPKNSAVVIAMFRDPYDWIEAMRERPHHAHDHIGLDWRSFVTKPWTGVRGENDKRLIETGQARGNETLVCMEHYSFKEIVPCSFDDSKKKNGYGNYKYELNHDGSEKPYSSIVDMRKEKILNHLTVRNFEGTRAFFPFRYEDLNKDGTGVLLEKLTEITGIEPKCDATKATGEVKHKTVPKEFMDWMNKYADWGVEGQIGYHQR